MIALEILAIAAAAGFAGAWSYPQWCRLIDWYEARDAARKANPLLLDPSYRNICAEIDVAIKRHAPRKHLYAAREKRVNELLGRKGA